MDLKRLDKLKLDHPADGELDNRAPRRKLWVILLLPLVVAGVAAYLIWTHSRGIERKEAAALTPQEQAPVPSPVNSSTFTAAGYLEPVPPYPITISALVPGRIAEFNILEGTPVRAGQVLAKLDSAQFQLQLNELEAQSRVAEAKLSQARTVLERTQQLASIGSASAKELDRAKADVSIAEADQQPIAAAIAQAKWRIENTEIRAPVDGVVFERLKNIGEFVSMDSSKGGAALLTIYDPTKIQAWVDVTQRDASRISVGQRVDIAIDAAPDRTYEGHVIRILPRASLQKNTIQLKVSIADPTPMFRPDMSVKITFHSENAKTPASQQ